MEKRDTRVLEDALPDSAEFQTPTINFLVVKVQPVGNVDWRSLVIGELSFFLLLFFRMMFSIIIYIV